MYCVKKITDDLTWVGGNDRRLAMFEGVYSVPTGVSYNSYLLTDETTVLFDTVDRAVSGVFFENVEHVLGGRSLDYVVVQHMEPDHSATLSELLRRWPDAVIVCNAKIQTMIGQFFPGSSYEYYIVKEGDKLATGNHEFTFVMAPMVHWPEVMMTVDLTTGTLFSADAFGCFGALNGAIFADEVDFFADYLGEARRYYCNIVGKYGPQVQAVLKKAAKLDLKMICPLHGFVWRRNLGDFIEKYSLWSSYTPEEQGVLIAYASVYGHTENAAELLSSALRDRGIKTAMYDVSVTPASEIIADAFRYSHFVFASTTYNAGIFVTMDELLRDLAAHAIKNRTVALIQNGSWAPTSGGLMRGILEECKNITFLEPVVTLKSSVNEEQRLELLALADAIADTFPKEAPAAAPAPAETGMGEIDPTALFSFSYGLFVLSASRGGKDNGCIINTAQQVTSQPNRISICVNKQNYTHDMILETGVFSLSVLSEEAQFDLFQRFGFASGRDTDKFTEAEKANRGANGVPYLTAAAAALISGRVIETRDLGTHTMFIADVTEARNLSKAAPMTYAYYFAHVKPKPAPKDDSKKGKVWVCKICGYEYDEEEEGVPFEKLPDDWVCPLCKHPKSDFELK